MSVSTIAFIGAVVIPLAGIFYVILWTRKQEKKAKA